MDSIISVLPDQEWSEEETAILAKSASKDELIAALYFLSTIATGHLHSEIEKTLDNHETIMGSEWIQTQQARLAIDKRKTSADFVGFAIQSVKQIRSELN